VKKLATTHQPRSLTAQRLQELRKQQGLSQAQLAKMLGVNQSAVAQWERDLVKPSSMALVAIGNVDRDNKDWWLQAAGGYQNTVYQGVSSAKKRGSWVSDDMIVVPILTSLVAAGTPLAASEGDEYEGSVAIPVEKHLGGSYVAAEVTGTSMLPRIEPGFLVVIDTAARSAEENVDKMVVVRGPKGLSVKFLCREAGVYFLVASNPSFRPRVQKIDEGNPWEIAGRVIRWIGRPSRG
jgi:transcriptional regulator with XRE-family HTH domain